MSTSAPQFIFDHEELNVYSKTLEFVSWVTVLLERVPKSTAVYGQLDRASTSMPLNIAEGTGKFTTRIDAATTIQPAAPLSSAQPAWMY